jgi:hypothetical protein
LLAHGWWFSPGIPVSSTTKTGRHEIAEILLNTKNKIKLLKGNSTPATDETLCNEFKIHYQ